MASRPFHTKHGGLHFYYDGNAVPFGFSPPGGGDALLGADDDRMTGQAFSMALHERERVPIMKGAISNSFGLTTGQNRGISDINIL